jgi:hypothetical protein
MNKKLAAEKVSAAATSNKKLLLQLGGAILQLVQLESILPHF